MRIHIYNHLDQRVGEVDADKLTSLTRIEEINGEHSLTLETTQELEKNQRLLFQDAQGYYHEYVIVGLDQTHETLEGTLNTYYAVWSVQFDLDQTIIKTMPGRVNPVAARVAMEHATAGTLRWGVGSVTQNTRGGASMYYLTGWESLGEVTKNWGGEISVTIDVAPTTGEIISRKVNLLSQLGSSEAVRRFDYAADITGIKRTVADEPFTCRITPRGSAIESESGGYGRKIDITSVNSGVEWLEDSEVVDLVKLPDGNGGWEYPNQIVEYQEIEDPATLKATALEHLHDYTRPRVTYEAQVLQLERAGLDAKGVELGDTVNVVDRAFTAEGLRLAGRITRMDIDELDPANNQLTIGFIPRGLPGQFDSLHKDIEALRAWQDTTSTPEYIAGLIDRINTEINATGGYAYLVEGLGLITYDVAVTDPATGAEASKATEVRGGSIRIANTKDAQGNWNWKTVFDGDQIAADLVRAAQITTGYIGNAGSTYINLDTGEIHLGDVNTSYGMDFSSSGITVEDENGTTQYSFTLDPEGRQLFRIGDHYGVYVHDNASDSGIFHVTTIDATPATGAERDDSTLSIVNGDVDFSASTFVDDGQSYANIDVAGSGIMLEKTSRRNANKTYVEFTAPIGSSNANGHTLPFTDMQGHHGLAFIDVNTNGTTYGTEMLIQSGAGMIIGAGEYPTNRYNLGDIYDTEVLFLGSDNAVNIEAGANTIASRRTWSFTGNGQILHNVHEIDLNNAPSARRARNATVWNDINGSPIGQVGLEQLANNTVGALFGSRRGTTYNQVDLRIDENGNRSVVVDDPKGWRNALKFRAGDTINMMGVICAGHVTTSTTMLDFFIPFGGLVDGSATYSVSGTITIRQNGQYLRDPYNAPSNTNVDITAATLTVNCTPRAGGVEVTATAYGPWVTNNAGTANAINNCPVSVYLRNDFVLTIS